MPRWDEDALIRGEGGSASQNCLKSELEAPAKNYPSKGLRQDGQPGQESRLSTRANFTRKKAERVRERVEEEVRGQIGRVEVCQKSAFEQDYSDKVGKWV